MRQSETAVSIVSKSHISWHG